MIFLISVKLKFGPLTNFTNVLLTYLFYLLQGEVLVVICEIKLLVV